MISSGLIGVDKTATLVAGWVEEPEGILMVRYFLRFLSFFFCLTNSIIFIM
jgi:hypothetical protein